MGAAIRISDKFLKSEDYRSQHAATKNQYLAMLLEADKDRVCKFGTKQTVKYDLSELGMYSRTCKLLRAGLIQRVDSSTYKVRVIRGTNGQEIPKDYFLSDWFLSLSPYGRMVYLTMDIKAGESRVVRYTVREIIEYGFAPKTFYAAINGELIDAGLVERIGSATYRLKGVT